MIVYHVLRETGDRRENKATGAALLALAGASLYAAVGIGRHGFFPENVLFALAFVPLVLGLKVCPVALLVNPVTRFFGKISYSAYLLHFFVLSRTRSLLEPFLSPWKDSLAGFLLLFGTALAGTAALSWLTWRFLEQPCIRLGAKLIERRRAAGLATDSARSVRTLRPSERVRA